MSLEYFLTFLLVGALAGWISGLIARGGGFGVVGNIIVGVIGAFLGNFCFGLLGMAATNILGRLIFAVIGSLVFVWLLKFVRR